MYKGLLVSLIEFKWVVVLLVDQVTIRLKKARNGWELSWSLFIELTFPEISVVPPVSKDRSVA